MRPIVKITWQLVIVIIIIIIKADKLLVGATLLCAVWFEPTDVAHICKLSETDVWKYLTYTSPNFAELLQMVAYVGAKMTSTLGLLQYFICICYLRHE